jgi:hypothetical protein
MLNAQCRGAETLEMQEMIVTAACGIIKHHMHFMLATLEVIFADDL